MFATLKKVVNVDGVNLPSFTHTKEDKLLFEFCS